MGPGMAWKPCASVRKGLRTEEKLVGGGVGEGLMLMLPFPE